MKKPSALYRKIPEKDRTVCFWEDGRLYFGSGKLMARIPTDWQPPEEEQTGDYYREAALGCFDISTEPVAKMNTKANRRALERVKATDNETIELSVREGGDFWIMSWPGEEGIRFHDQLEADVQGDFEAEVDRSLFFEALDFFGVWEEVEVASFWEDRFLVLRGSEGIEVRLGMNRKEGGAK